MDDIRIKGNKNIIISANKVIEHLASIALEILPRDLLNIIVHYGMRMRHILFLANNTNILVVDSENEIAYDVTFDCQESLNNKLCGDWFKGEFYTNKDRVTFCDDELIIHKNIIPIPIEDSNPFVILSNGEIVVEVNKFMKFYNPEIRKWSEKEHRFPISPVINLQMTRMSNDTIVFDGPPGDICFYDGSQINSILGYIFVLPRFSPFINRYGHSCCLIVEEGHLGVQAYNYTISNWWTPNWKLPRKYINIISLFVVDDRVYYVAKCLIKNVLKNICWVRYLYKSSKWKLLHSSLPYKDQNQNFSLPGQVSSW